ncbi:hypothetical protein VIMS_04933 [Mycobacterium marinum]|nr:hypothetical protein VIMS_04933 [Mycobacterium marinum]
MHAFAQSFALRLSQPSPAVSAVKLAATAVIALAKIKCSSCPNTFIGRAGSRYCSPACKQRAHRANRNANAETVTDTEAERVTVTAPAGKGSRFKRDQVTAKVDVTGGHSAEAVALLQKLDAELAENAEQLGEPLSWSAADVAIRELVADTIDRRSELKALYRSTKDDKLRLKIAGELRLIESALARLLVRIKTDLPAAPSKTSRKATAAARARWDRA